MTLTQGTSLWAIQQMLEGKKITNSIWNITEFIQLIEGKLLCERGIEHPLSLVSDYTKGWQLWIPPNPHTKGTFAWAWEEIQRGNKVKVYEPSHDPANPRFFWMNNGTLMHTLRYDDNVHSPLNAISVTLINSTKWELA